MSVHSPPYAYLLIWQDSKVLRRSIEPTTQSGHSLVQRVATEQHRPEICGTRWRTQGLPFSDDNYCWLGDSAGLGAVMKKLATAIAAVALIGTPAFAADMAVKAPPPAPAHSGAQLSSWEFRVTAALRP
jgi:hypothetical protein